MKKTIGMTMFAVIVVGTIGVLVHAQQPAATQQGTMQPGTTQPPSRFAAVDVFIDSGSVPLAAYQFELKATRGAFKIVGIEGGEHAAFSKKPPYYDPAALMHDRVIIAAFNTGKDLPTGKTRVARVHVEISGNEEPQYDVQLIVAGGADGNPITATASWSTAK